MHLGPTGIIQDNLLNHKTHSLTTSQIKYINGFQGLGPVIFRGRYSAHYSGLHEAPDEMGISICYAPTICWMLSSKQPAVLNINSRPTDGVGFQKAIKQT